MLMLPDSVIHLVCKHLVLSFLLLSFISANAQSSEGILKGKIFDGRTFKSLYGVIITVNSKSVNSFADGHYDLSVPAGKYTITFQLKGFQPKEISEVSIQPGVSTDFDILLYPTSEQELDSVKSHSFIKTSFRQERKLRHYYLLSQTRGYADVLSGVAIQPGTDKDGAASLKRLNGLVVSDDVYKPGLQQLNAFGMGQRYNQVVYDKIILNSFDPFNRSYPLAMLPVES